MVSLSADPACRMVVQFTNNTGSAHKSKLIADLAMPVTHVLLFLMP